MFRVANPETWNKIVVACMRRGDDRFHCWYGFLLEVIQRFWNSVVTNGTQPWEYTGAH